MSAVATSQLEQARVLIRRGGQFMPDEVALLLAAGLSPQFSPATSDDDRAIDTALTQLYGTPWNRVFAPTLNQSA